MGTKTKTSSGTTTEQKVAEKLNGWCDIHEKTHRQPTTKFMDKDHFASIYVCNKARFSANSTPLQSKNKKKDSKLGTAIAEGFTTIIWVAVAIVSKQIFLYFFALCLFLSLILMIDQIKVIDRFLLIRPFSETTVKDMQKEKNPLMQIGLIGIITSMLVGMTAVLLPYLFILRIKRIIT